MKTKLETIRTSEIDFANVEKIYFGKDRGCRCGCNGTYFNPESEQFENKIRTIKSLGKVEALVSHDGYINIPHKGNNAFTLYFK